MAVPISTIAPRSRGASGRSWSPELACHPGRVNGDFGSRYLHEREVELATLTEPGLAAAIESLGVELVSFHAWKQLRSERRFPRMLAL
jgi:predicted glycoside hydrolase/deacetylase ChbG (UPF0249 family)